MPAKSTSRSCSSTSGANPQPLLGVVTPKYKYINWFYGADGFQPAEELYDMQSDRSETKNLATSPENRSSLESLCKAYDQWLDQWQAEGVPNNGYPKYTRLADRSRPFATNDPQEIHSMAPAPKKNRPEAFRSKLPQSLIPATVNENPTQHRCLQRVIELQSR